MTLLSAPSWWQLHRTLCPRYSVSLLLLVRTFYQPRALGIKSVGLDSRISLPITGTLIAQPTDTSTRHSCAGLRRDLSATVGALACFGTCWLGWLCKAQQLRNLQMMEY